MPAKLSREYHLRREATQRSETGNEGTRTRLKLKKNRDHMKMLVDDCLLSRLAILPLLLHEFDNGIDQSK